MNLSVIQLNIDDERWNKFIETSHQNTFFSNRVWLSILKDGINKEISICAVFKGNNILGGCLVYPQKVFSFRISDTPPLTPFWGTLLLNPQTDRSSNAESLCRDVINAICNHLKNRFDYIRITNHLSLVDIRPFIWNGWRTQVRYTYIVDISDTEQLWKRMDNDVKRQIKKAEDNGITIVEGNNYDILYDLYCKTFLNQGIKVKLKLDFFRLAYERITSAGLGKLYLAKDKLGNISASALITHDDDTLYYTIAGSDPETRNTGAPSLLLWEVFKNKLSIVNSQSSINKFDFVGANTPHLVQFKKGFGGSLVPYYVVDKYSSLVSRFSLPIIRKFIF